MQEGLNQADLRHFNIYLLGWVLNFYIFTKSSIENPLTDLYFYMCSHRIQHLANPFRSCFCQKEENTLWRVCSACITNLSHFLESLFQKFNIIIKLFWCFTSYRLVRYVIQWCVQLYLVFNSTHSWFTELFFILKTVSGCLIFSGIRNLGMSASF